MLTNLSLISIDIIPRLLSGCCYPCRVCWRGNHRNARTHLRSKLIPVAEPEPSPQSLETEAPTDELASFHKTLVVPNLPAAEPAPEHLPASSLPIRGTQAHPNGTELSSTPPTRAETDRVARRKPCPPQNGGQPDHALHTHARIRRGSQTAQQKGPKRSIYPPKKSNVPSCTHWNCVTLLESGLLEEHAGDKIH
jgi:hypothetical protein